MIYLRNCKSKLLLFIITVICSFGLCGCAAPSQEDIYYYVLDQTQQLQMGSSEPTSDMTFAEQVYNTTVQISDNTKVVAPYIIIVSIIIGVLILSLIKKEAKIRQKAFFLFIIIIPAITLIATYGLAFFSDWLR